MGADQPFGSARLGSEKRFLTIRRERVHLCKLSNLRFSLAYLVTSLHVAHRSQGVRKEQRRASAAPSGHRPLRTPPRECNKCSAPSPVYPFSTEQWLVPPCRGSSSLGQMILPRIICLAPSRPKGLTGGPYRVVLRPEESGGLPPAAWLCRLPMYQFTCQRKA